LLIRVVWFECWRDQQLSLTMYYAEFGRWPAKNYSASLSATSESYDYPDAEFERLRICFSAGKLEKRLSDAGTFETLFPMRIVNGGPFCTEA
jgi:hypothetical protein